MEVANQLSSFWGLFHVLVSLALAFLFIFFWVLFDFLESKERKESNGKKCSRCCGDLIYNPDLDCLECGKCGYKER